MTVPALLPNGAGHQFVVYGDSTSGVPNGLHAATLAAVNHVVARLEPAPEFVCFLGDEIKGLLADEEALRAQWAYWLTHEMAWLDRARTPLYHTTANHTTYDAASERVFRDVLAHLPQNGPPMQRGLSYFVRRGDLLLVFVNTMWSGLGGEGTVETVWLDATLAAHADARYKLVLGHHPVWAVNGYWGDRQRVISAEYRNPFWQTLVRHGVLAYLCSHIMAFDVQVHAGVLQILTAGAGTQPLMPESAEYLHCVQMALDGDGLRYQVLDTAGRVREALAWPLPPVRSWLALPLGRQAAHTVALSQGMTVWRFAGETDSAENAAPQTLLAAHDDSPYISPLWIGISGAQNQLGVQICFAAGRSPRHWIGPTLPPGVPFTIDIAFCPAMGPGGILWRHHSSDPWQSLIGSTAWGADKLPPLPSWTVGHARAGATDKPFRGPHLTVAVGVRR